MSFDVYYYRRCRPYKDQTNGTQQSAVSHDDDDCERPEGERRLLLSVLCRLVGHIASSEQFSNINMRCLNIERYACVMFIVGVQMTQ